MPWYVVRTRPGAQLPKREYETEATRSRKGYRILTTLDPDLSAVEKALGEAGFACYMPAEKRLLRDRLRPFLWKHRRFALMVGYVFVHAPGALDFAKVRAVPGVAGVLCGLDDQPLVIPLAEILYIRAIEARAEAAFDAASRAARQQIRKAAKTDPSLRRIVEGFDRAGMVTAKPGELIAAA